MNEEVHVEQGKKFKIYNTTLLAYIIIAWLFFIPIVFLTPRLDLFEVANAVCFCAGLGLATSSLFGMRSSCHHAQ
jgi:hypothetical protein